jgi:hypothetical protein
MHWKLFGHDIYYADPSGWSISGTGSSAAFSVGVRDIQLPGPFQGGISMGAAMGHVRFAPNEHSVYPYADRDVTHGHHLRKLKRWYEATMYGVTVSISGNTESPQLPIGGSFSVASADFDSHGIGRILRMAGAPNPSGEPGAPTGFLGVALQYTGSAGTSNGFQAGVSGLLMGSNIVGLMAGKAPSWLADNLAHGGSVLFGHLAFKYAGAYESTAVVTSTTRLAFTAGLEYQLAWIPMLDMYVKEGPEGQETDYYVHTYELDNWNNVVITDRSWQVSAPSYRV